MDKEYIKMCREAVDIQNEWEPKSGDIYHFYSVVNPKKQCMLRPDANDFIIIHSDSNKINKFWLPSQEDLQEIYMEDTGRPASMLMAEICMWMGDHPYPRDHEVWQDITRLWLTFVMEKMFYKSWNSEIGKWEKVWWKPD